MKTKGIYKRGEIYWISYAGLDGKINRESSHSKKFRAAETLRANRVKDIRDGKAPEVIKPIPNHSFGYLADQYDSFVIGEKGYQQKGSIVKTIKEKWGSLPIRGITPMLIEQYQTTMLLDHKPATANRHIVTIKHMMKKAVEWNLVEESFLKRLGTIKQKKEGNARLRYLQLEECTKLIDACSPFVRPFVIMALNTGMRRGEIFKLKWDDVDLTNRFISVKDSKNSDRREIPINDTMKAVFDSLPRHITSPYVFCHTGKGEQSGNRFTDIKGSFLKAVRKAGIKDFHFHDLRHTFASHLAMGGIDIPTLKDLLGHKTIQMTLRYAHLSPGHRSSAVRLLDGKMGGSKSTTQKLHNLSATAYPSSV